METKQIDMMVCARCENKFTMNQIHDVNDEPYCDNCYEYLCARSEAQYDAMREDGIAV